MMLNKSIKISIFIIAAIILGIASIVCVVAIGNGSQQKILSDISSLGTNTMDIFNGKSMGDRLSSKVKNLTIADTELLEKQSYVVSTTPNNSSSGTLVYENLSLSANIKGVGEQYFDVKGISIETGRLFSKDEVITGSQVALIDQNIKSEVFKNEDPIGKIILFNKKPLKIIGTISTKDVMGMNSSELNIYCPYTVVMYKIVGQNHIDSITVKITNEVDSQAAQKGITALLTAKHGEKDFFILNTDTLKKTIETTTNTMKLLISCIALISLIVGGIGVMNIMLVSVTERTKEIGIRMAVGAKQRDILEQFLIEAILICLIGGIIGIFSSLMIGWLFNSIVTSFVMMFSASSIIMAVLSSTLIGVVFGYVPAKNAAKLDPINALSRE